VDQPQGSRSDQRAASEAQTDPLNVLLAIAQQRRALDAAEREFIERARQQGLTFAQIGAVLGVSRQAVHAKLRRSQADAAHSIGALASYNDVLDAAFTLLT
jgi:DNA-directed RNA polymerase specialized sigma24 family protein